MLLGGFILTWDYTSLEYPEKTDENFTPLKDIFMSNAQMLPSKERFGFLYITAWLTVVLSFPSLIWIL